MGQRFARANLYNQEGAWARSGSYVYYIKGEKPTDAILNASPAFPNNARIGTPLWTFSEDMLQGEPETEHPDAVAYGVVVVSAIPDYIGPHHFTDSFVTIQFATVPKSGLSPMTMLPVVRWTGQSSIEYKTVYHDLSATPVLVPEGMSIAYPILRLTATIDNWITNSPMREFIGAVNEQPFKTFPAGEVLYAGFSEELVHGVSSAGDYGRSNITLEFMVKPGGWDEERPLRDPTDGTILTGPSGVLTQTLKGYRSKPFAYLFAGTEPGSGVNQPGGAG